MTLLKKKFRLIGLRGKLLLSSLLILLLPIAGLSYLKELETFLKKSHAESVIVSAQTIASTFRDNASLLTMNQLTQSPNPIIYCHPITYKKKIDGLNNDWPNHLNQEQLFFPETLSKVAQKKTIRQTITQTIIQTLALNCTNDDDFYYFFIQITNPINNQLDSLGTFDFTPKQTQNKLQIEYLNYAQEKQSYLLSIDVLGLLNINGNKNINKTSVLQGQWKKNLQGYSIELKLPINEVNHFLSLKLLPIKSNDQDIFKPIISTIASNKSKQINNSHHISVFNHYLEHDTLNPIIFTDPLSNYRLAQLQTPNTRLWLINKKNYVSAKAVSTEQVSNNKTTSSILALYRKFYIFIMNYPEQLSFYKQNQAIIKNNNISRSLKGESIAQWLDKPLSQKMILSVSVPVYDNSQNIIGVLILEQSNETLLALQDSAFEQILLFSAVLFFTILLTLFYFSTRLLKRIIRLRDDTEKAINKEGTINNQLYRKDNDEVGDLARSFSSLLEQIEQNNQYLRSLSGKLSHELRTPLSIIKSSIENLQMSSMNSEQSKYSERAHDGCNRLNTLLNRMSEASRLEQSINNIEKENLDMVSFLSHYMASIQSTYPELNFNFDTHCNEYYILFSPDLIAQLLDKLISNAISFHQENTPIKLELNTNKQGLQIRLSNEGELIDKNKLTAIFSSLTSYREKQSKHSHLGLGLHIARLISHYHQATLIAVNTPKKKLVTFILQFNS